MGTGAEGRVYAVDRVQRVALVADVDERQVGALVLSLTIGARAAGPSIADAAMRGDRTDVLALIKQGADVNAPQGDGVTALLEAAWPHIAEARQAEAAAAALVDDDRHPDGDLQRQ